MKNFLLLLSFLLVGTFGYGQLKIETTGDGTFFDGAAGNRTLTLGKNRASSGNLIVDLNGSAADEAAGYGFRFLRTSTGSSRFIHKGTGQYQFLADNAANIAFFSDGTQIALFRHTTGNFEVKVGDAFKIGGGPFSALSDKRLKSNVQEYEDGLKEVMQLRPVTYNYTANIDPNQKEFVGVIAQELEKVAPYMTNDYDLIDVEDKDLGTYLSVDPNAFTYMLINAVQEQQEMISERDAEMDALQNQVAELTELVKDLNTILTAQGLEESNETNITLIGDPASLAQNEPNPFNELTRINYVIPEGSTKAIIRIVDNNGKLVKAVNVEGSGTLNVETQNLPSGNYHYSLIVDNKIVDTKTMIFSK